MTIGPQFDSLGRPKPDEHETYVKYEGVLPYAWCSCGWEGQTRDHDREAADDVRAHRRETA